MTEKPLPLTVELRDIRSITPYDRNPRINDNAVDAVAASLKEFGFRQPLVVDADGIIIAGHTRYKAALKLGLQKVPVHIATDLSPEQVKAYRIADNKTGEIAEWDLTILPIELKELQESGFDLKTLAFNDKELNKLLTTELKEGLTNPDEVPETPENAITQRGGVYLYVVRRTASSLRGVHECGRQVVNVYYLVQERFYAWTLRLSAAV